MLNLFYHLGCRYFVNYTISLPLPLPLPLPLCARTMSGGCMPFTHRANTKPPSDEKCSLQWYSSELIFFPQHFLGLACAPHDIQISRRLRSMKYRHITWSSYFIRNSTDIRLHYVGRNKNKPDNLNSDKNKNLIEWLWNPPPLEHRHSELPNHHSQNRHDAKCQHYGKHSCIISELTSHRHLWSNLKHTLAYKYRNFVLVC
jgi:hypothetical protein